MYGYKSCEKSNFTVFMLYGLLGYIRFFILVHVVQLLFKAILFLLGINLATEVQIAWRQTRLLSELDLIPKLLYFGFDVQEVPLTFFFFFQLLFFIFVYLCTSCSPLGQKQKCQKCQNTVKERLSLWHFQLDCMQKIPDILEENVFTDTCPAQCLDEYLNI